MPCLSGPAQAIEGRGVNILALTRGSPKHASTKAEADKFVLIWPWQNQKQNQTKGGDKAL